MTHRVERMLQGSGYSTEVEVVLEVLSANVVKWSALAAIGTSRLHLFSLTSRQAGESDNLHFDQELVQFGSSFPHERIEPG